MDDVRARIVGHHWWHTIAIGKGIVTPGGWDLRPTAARMPWPASLAGLRCLDIGTMDGFWAFEMEDRGAAEVLATDLADPARAQFDVAVELRGSGVRYRTADVHDLDPADLGQFDLVVVGYVLQMVPDPLRALAAIRSVCRGWIIVLDTVSLPLSLLPSPLARLNARRGHLEHFVFNRAGLAQALTMAGFTVEATTPILRDHAGPGAGKLSPPTRLKHALGLLGRSLAIRARPANSSTPARPGCVPPRSPGAAGAR